MPYKFGAIPSIRGTPAAHFGLAQAVIYFVTFCVAMRRKVRANPVAFSAFGEAISDLGTWKIIAAILMPDHVHLLVGPNEREALVGSLSAAIKRRIRRRIGAQWQWQPGCFDRLLRSDESAEEKWHYIRENPVRAGLVKDWRDWPYRIGRDL